MSTLSSPTLTIQTALLNAQNPLFAQLAAHVGAQVQQSEFYAAVIQFLQQLAAGSSSLPAASTGTHQIAHKKRKRMSGDGDGSDDDNVVDPRFVVQVQPRELLLTPSMPPDDSAASYSILPQHIILGIFEYIEKLVDFQLSLTSLLCRFRSQVSERQYHLQYRSIRVDTVEWIRTMGRMERHHVIIWRQICGQIRNLCVVGNEIEATIVFFGGMSESMWPQLKRIALNVSVVGQSIFNFISERMPAFVRQRITRVDDESHYPFTDDVASRLATLLPNISALYVANAGGSLASFSRLTTFSAEIFASDNLRDALVTCTSLKHLHVSNPIDEQVFDDSSILSTSAATGIRLRSLVLDRNFTTRNIPAIPTLVQLTVNLTSGQFDFQDIEKLKYLETLSLYCDYDKEPAFVNCSRIAASPRLAHLVIEEVQWRCTEENERIAFFDSIRSLNERGQLSHLGLHNVIFVEEGDIPRGAQVVSLKSLGIDNKCALRHLELHGFYIFDSDEFAFQLLGECKYLRRVTISGFPAVIDWSLENGNILQNFNV